MEWIAKKEVGPCHIVLGAVDSRLTIYVTKTDWDGQIKVHMDNGKLVYEDINGDEMLVYKEHHTEFKFYHEYASFDALPRRIMKNIISNRFS